MRFSASLLLSAAIAAMTEATTLRVDVGLNGLTFTPNSTAAAVGDVVEFHFHPKDHSVVQSSFASPCNSSSLATPFSSGFMPVSSGEGASVFRVTVNSTSPIWFFCGQVLHCQSGMVGVINEPASGNTLAAYAAKAKGTSSSTQPPAVQGGVVVPNSSNSASASTSAASWFTGASTTSSAGVATYTSAGVMSLQAVSWSELLGLGAFIGGAAVLMQ